MRCHSHIYSPQQRTPACSSIDSNIDDIIDDDIIDEFGLSMLPSLVYFEAGIPTVYESGDLKNHAAILGWVTTELRRTTIR